MLQNITLVAGPDAAESEIQTWDMAHKISSIGKIAKPYGIDTYFRAGVWKPRTKYWEKINSQRIDFFHKVIHLKGRIHYYPGRQTLPHQVFLGLESLYRIIL